MSRQMPLDPPWCDVVVWLRDDRAVDTSLRRTLMQRTHDAPSDPLDVVLCEATAGTAQPLFTVGNDVDRLSATRRVPWVLPLDSATPDRHLVTMNLLRVGSAEAAHRLARTLRSDRRVRDAFVAPDRTLCGGSGALAEPRQHDQWALATCNFQSAWASTVGKALPALAIVDSGITATHPDIPDISRLTTFDLGVSDAGGHGTAVAGIAAAPINGVGIAGGCSASVEVYKVFADSFVRPRYYDALHLLRESSAKVVNCSFGTLTHDPVEEQLLADCAAKGKIVVAPMGNLGEFPAGSTVYPAAFSTVIAVGATNSADERASFSLTGPYIALCAPGTDILSTSMDGDYGFVSGTSFASPLVAAACCLICAKHGDLSVNDVRTRLAKLTVPIDGQTAWTVETGHGRLDLSTL